MILEGLEPAIFSSEDQRLIHEATGPVGKNGAFYFNAEHGWNQAQSRSPSER